MTTPWRDVEIPLEGTVGDLATWLQQFAPSAAFTLAASVGIPEFRVEAAAAGRPAHSTIRAAIELVAPQHGLDPDLVEAVVLTESGGDPHAWNPEPHYRYLVDVRTGRPFRALTAAEIASERPPADFRALGGDPDQEWWAQQASWGLLQVMGAVAREYGYRAPYLPSLCDVMANLQIGCRHLAAQIAWAKGDIDLGLRAYNGGRGGARQPQTAPYPVKVRGHLAAITGGTRRT